MWEAFALYHFLSADRPVGLRDSLRTICRQVRKGRADDQCREQNGICGCRGTAPQTRGCMAVARMRAASCRRQSNDRGGHSVSRSRTDQRPHAIVALGPQATERHHRHEAEPQAHLPEAGNVSPCGWAGAFRRRTEFR